MNGLSLKPYSDSSPKWNAMEMLGDSAQLLRGVAGIVVALDADGLDNVYMDDSLQLLQEIMLCASDAIEGAAAILHRDVTDSE